MKNPKSEIGDWTARSALECGDLSSLFPLRRLVGEAALRRAARRITGGTRFARSPLPNGCSRSLACGGDKSSAQSGDKSPHSKAGAWVAALLAGLALVSTVHAQSYSIDWFKIAGGGGTSTGGVYSVSGTIGQPDAGGPLTNGQYSVTGGFWVLPIAVQDTNAPALTIAPATPGNAMISWTPSTPGFVLQETWVLSPANWTNSLSGAANPVVVPATLPTKFYRVFKP
jgi:hypothetical protein